MVEIKDAQLAFILSSSSAEVTSWSRLDIMYSCNGCCQTTYMACVLTQEAVSISKKWTRDSWRTWSRPQ